MGFWSWIHKQAIMKQSKQIVQRYSGSDKDTLSLFFVDNKFFSYGLEDEYREVKVAGETRIPAGTYELKIKEVLTSLTKHYRSKYSWFEYFIEITGVPGFSSVYVHIGNKDEDTDACYLIADTANNNQIEKGFIGSSSPAFERWYKDTYKRLKDGEKIFIEFRDENKIT